MIAVFVVNQHSLAESQLRLIAQAVQADYEQSNALQRAMLKLNQRAFEDAILRAKWNDPAVLSGDAARAAHAAEWKRRLAHEPALANSAVEQALVRMHAVSSDTTLTAQAALERVAQLAAPRGSRIEIMPNGERFVVRIAFKMSALSTNEQGAVTKHHTPASMKREVEALCARVARDVFDHCGPRAIDQLFITCNHTLRRRHIPEAATAAERDELQRRATPVMARLYRVRIDRADALRVTEWRTVSESQLIALMKVEHDAMKTLRINSSLFDARPGIDANMKLEF